MGSTVAERDHLLDPPRNWIGEENGAGARCKPRSQPNSARWEEIFIENPLAEIFTEPLPKAKNDVVDLPQRPGMGLALDKKKIAKYRLI